jgi:hypothetical protein
MMDTKDHFRFTINKGYVVNLTDHIPSSNHSDRTNVVLSLLCIVIVKPFPNSELQSFTKSDIWRYLPDDPAQGCPGVKLVGGMVQTNDALAVLGTSGC